jgi:signal transduction histidine kinase
MQRKSSEDPKPSMRILHLEDDPIDTELVCELLKNEEICAEIDRIDTLEAFRDGLAKGEYSVILSDYSVPGVDPVEALQVARELRPEIPFLFLSGTIGEEMAIELLHLGASDCVLKDRMGRLVPAVRRAIREAQEQIRRLEAEEALRAAKETAEAGNRAKDRFLLAMSHELRTPLTVTMGMLDLSLAEELPPTIRHYLDSARKSSETLLSLISDILDFAGIEQGHVALEEERFDLPECLRECVDALHPEATGKDLGLTLRLEPGLPQTVIGDRARLSQILRNVLDNAVRFTERGRIDVSVAVGAVREKAREVTINVRDTGIGIPEETLEHLFQRFSQADMSLTRRFHGAGLGLAISRGLVERMAGRIEAKSTEGQGSTFSIVIPFKISEEDSAPAVKGKGPEGGTRPRILVAEDEPMIAELIRIVLEREGWQADVVPDGRAALERWFEGGYAIVLLDLQMPGMDGLEAARRIRAREDGSERTPIIAVTAHAREEDRRACRQAGMDDVLVKPLQMPVLTATVRKWLGS